MILFSSPLQCFFIATYLTPEMSATKQALLEYCSSWQTGKGNFGLVFRTLLWSCFHPSHRFSFLLEGAQGSEVLLISKKGELVQPQLFRATPHSSHTLLNHFHTMQNPTPSPPLRSAVPVHASPSVALPNPFVNELKFAKLAAPRIPQCAPFATRPSAVES